MTFALLATPVRLHHPWILTMPDPLGLIELHHLQHPGWVSDETSSFRLLADGLLELGVASLVQRDPRKQVVDQAHKERLILIHLRKTQGSIPSGEAPH